MGPHDVSGFNEPGFEDPGLEREVDSLLAGRRPLVQVSEPTAVHAVFPGSFNPLHRGHRRIVGHARRRLGCEVHFELSVENVDKPALNWRDIRRRLAQFERHDRIVLTRAPRFIDKARLFPQATFVVGIDTLVRLADPRYASVGEDHSRSLESLCEAARFLVFGRILDGVFQGLRGLDVPPCLAASCEEVPEAEFREDISSTSLRDKPP